MMSPAASKNSACRSSPICTRARSVYPARTNADAASTTAPMSSPQGICSATSDSRTVAAASAKAAVPGSSALTFQPPRLQRNSSWARRTAADVSAPQEMGN